MEKQRKNSAVPEERKHWFQSIIFSSTISGFIQLSGLQKLSCAERHMREYIIQEYFSFQFDGVVK
jgi:hypothetical protein